MLDLLPTTIALCLIVAFVRRNRGSPVLQIYALIVASYLNVFPLLDYLFSGGDELTTYGLYQWLVLVFFEIPMMWVANRICPRRAGLPDKDRVPLPASLSPIIPALQVFLLLGFWLVALKYNLFFRRQGHEGLLEASASVPGPLLYVYRAAVETAFLSIMFLWTTLRTVTSESRHYRLYQMMLAGYLATFVLFFGANSSSARCYGTGNSAARLVQTCLRGIPTVAFT